MSPRRIIVGMTGATGSIFAIRLLQAVRDAGGIDTHLVVSKWGLCTMRHETSFSYEDLCRLATHVHPPTDLGASISSGSFLTDGMIIVPCSMRTLAAIASGVGDNLIHRAADVTLKERRRLVVAPRELPLNEIHIENMLRLTRAGAVIAPPMPAFYNAPQTLHDMVDHIVVRLLDPFGIHLDENRRWNGMRPAEERHIGKIAS